MAPEASWRQQILPYLPICWSNEGLASVAHLKSDDKTLHIFLSHWPYPNKWPIPGLTRKPLPQLFLLEVAPGSYDNWSVLQARIKQDLVSGAVLVRHRLNIRRIDQLENGGLDVKFSGPASISSLAKTERETLAHVLCFGERDFKNLPAYLLYTSFESLLMFQMYGLCRVAHGFPWVALCREEQIADGTGTGLPCKVYASGVSQGYWWESMQARINKVIDGSAELFWDP